MRSFLGAIVDKASGATPVPFTSKNFQVPMVHRNDAQTQMQSMGTVGTLFSIVNRCAEATASVEWKLYRSAKIGKKDDRVEVPTHPALVVLNRPNSFTTRQELIESGQQHHDLTGETWLIIGRHPMSTMPIELWAVRPDRMAPVPCAENFIKGYIYMAPDGTKVPLGLDDVIMIRRPNPLDPYRGMGPVQAVMNHIDGERYASEWNRNFFINGAEPGGIIEVDRNLSDDEFDQMTARWRDQHRGLANAHRVAVLEQAHYIERKFNQKDMQFTELSNLSDEKIRRAFGFPKPMLGDTEDSNRAVAQAAEYVFARWLVVPRLERWKQALNTEFLPLFGTLGEGYEFDYESPVPEDEELETRERDSKVKAVVDLVGAGFEPSEVLSWLELPELPHTTPAAPEPPLPMPAGVVSPAPASATARGREHRSGHGGRSCGCADDDGEPWHNKVEIPEPPDDVRGTLPEGVGPDLAPVQESWLAELDNLLALWVAVDTAWKQSILEAIADHVADGNVLGLSTITLDVTAGAAAIEDAMTALATVASSQVVAEAADQGLEEGAIHTTTIDKVRTAATAQVVAGALGQIVIGSAVGETLRTWRQGATSQEVIEQVSNHLASLTDAAPRQYLGAALGQAQHEARLQTFAKGPEAALYADEVLDAIVCDPCRSVNRKWLGNASDAMSTKLYPVQGYIYCKGRSRCRGQVVAVWRGGDDYSEWVEMPKQRKA